MQNITLASSKSNLYLRLFSKQQHMVTINAALAPQTHLTQEEVQDIEVEMFSNSLYSPDLAPREFFLFPELKTHL